MLEEKEKIHTENDPEEIYELAGVFDFRFWNAEEKYRKTRNLEETKEELQKTFKENLDNADVMLIGEDLEVLMEELTEATNVLLEKCFEDNSFYKKLLTQKTVSQAWRLALKHPSLKNLKVLTKAVDRLTTIANSEAGCERANSKYNKMKNRLRTSMKLPMIQARMRAGSNGPPLHRFDPKETFNYWKKTMLILISEFA